MTIFLIAEIGINHNGDVNIAKQLIDHSVEAGFNAVKFQKRDVESVYSKEMLDSLRESPWGTTQREQKEGLEFGLAEYEEIDAYCKEKNIVWFASPWDLKSVEFLRAFDCQYAKVASAMITHRDLLTEMAKDKRHTFISTGMSTVAEIATAVEIFRNANCSFELMHCVSTYPMAVEHANLNAIDFLRKKFKCDVGYSGHETGLAVSIAASTLGISSLERHITLDRAMYGSDQSASIEPVGMVRLVDYVRTVEKAMGDGKKRVLDQEIPIAKKLRAHFG